MSKTNEAAEHATGTLNSVERKIRYPAVIIILGKVVAFFKDNCYHIFVDTQGLFPVLFRERQGLGRLIPVFFIVTG